MDESGSTQLGIAGLTFTEAGRGEPVLFIHGLISDHRTWSAQMEALSASHRVIAPDLFGHGEVDDSDGGLRQVDFSLGGHAAAIRDLLDGLGLDRVIVVGHSLGGGVALELAYLFPERVRALALVSSGGLGPDLSPALRLATLPGSEFVLPIIASSWIRACGNTAFGLMARLGLPLVTASTEAAWLGMGTFANAANRRAFLATSRSVIDVTGQTVSALPRLAGLAGRPILVVWGGRDRLIPASHAEAVRTALPDSRVEIFPRAGHFPHLDEPERFHLVLADFIGGLTN
ncbi:Pimeloyl-ACP methyl ester carboxylesterase [Nakamurella panacisegetis]|uniref:Pimeloyl-ACP methyl ester carboxylesterase n=1 Tax=Nakamurella panacisegetis TaxID=1090615 RepID=A0A1H0SDM3_9ACTN|nr:alpha/beta fold hydrolase [Nakamurella panacisegetis]SDP39765.1 Pimeloyl-ACP methyl ester carboxylesterase [Nakamurella panacisegetis]